MTKKKKNLFSITDCQLKIFNGICDQQCNKIDCDYDRDDCLSMRDDDLLGTIILQLEIDKKTFNERKELFLQRLGTFSIFFFFFGFIFDKKNLNLLHNCRFNIE